MAVLALPMLILLAMAGYSRAAYCVCNTGLSDSVLQKNIDYACAQGADCGQISQNGPCFNPNTVKDHCNFAVNSYFQKKGQTADSCSFSGTATVTSSAPSGATSACFSGSASSSTPTNPTIAPPGTGTGTGTGTGMGTGNGTGSGMGTGTGTSTGTGMGTTNPAFGGMAPSGTINNDNSAAMTIHQTTTWFGVSTLLIMGLVWSRII
ncbi:PLASMODESMATA CALLOSE-BINDING PROTEIN 3 [Lactuca sativa]|uniref:X8 domain-containing protein n=1 Tax=Lactuca sativa TaxID=4236 RepID=A0A9R1W153_LACSA|nr:PLASMODESMATA CALLOSE-BINDING PROTEIN 3 [Lactuca sativa]KAJ0214331.1 hypothetical protein LSAT_V11C400162040 [Lactuca sativa]